MAIREQLIIEGKNNTGRAFGQVQKDLRGMESSLGSVTKLAAGLVAALGFQQLASSTVNTIRKFQDLGAVLKTVEGDAEKAARSMDLIREFTKTTTFQLDDVTQAFITLRNAGLQPTEAFMTDIGNIAAGMGRRIDDVAKAVFNATTGEFEMLKQLGIKVRTEGDKLTVQFRGTTKTIANDGRAIVGLIQEISQTSFSTGLADSANTLTGAISNMKDAAEEFQVAIGDAGLTAELTAFTREITATINGAEGLSHSIGQVATRSVAALRTGFQFLVKNSDEVKGAFGAIAAVGLAGVIRNITIAVRALTVAIAMNPVGALITGVIALAGYLSFKNGLGRTLAQVKAVVDLLGEAFSRFAQFIREKVSAVINKLKDIFLSFVQSAINGYNTLADFLPLLERFEGDASDLTGIIVELGKDGLEYVGGKANEMKDALENAVPDSIKQGLETVKKGAIEAGNAVSDAGKKYDEMMAKEKAAFEAQLRMNMKASEATGGTAGGTGTVTDKGLSKEQKKLQEALKKRVDKIRDSARSEQEVLQDQRAKDLQDLRDYYGTRIAFDTEYLRLYQSVQEKFAAAEKKLSERRVSDQFSIIKDGNMSELDLTKMTKEEVFALTKKTGRQAITELAQVNKEAFELNKAMNIASAIMNTATGVTKALAQGGVFGPFLAGAILAMGAAQVAIISKQQYAGRQMGGPVGAGQNYIVGEKGPEVFRAPPGGGMIEPNGRNNGHAVNINFNVEAIDGASFQDTLAENRSAIISLVNEAVNDSGRRSII